MNSSFPTIYPVTCHTDYVGKGSTFVAITGMKDDGMRHIPTAIAQGATTVVIEHSRELSHELQNLCKDHNIAVVQVADARKALAQLSARAYDYPAKKLKIIAVTGTKGKSTTVFLIEHILRTAGIKTALLSTVYNKILGTVLSTQLTTQQPDYLHTFFNECVHQEVEWVVMEVAAQAFSLHRVEGLEFDCGVFTNFSQEHAEFYKTQDDYFAAKKQLLQQLKSGAPFLINSDDHKVSQLVHDYAHTVTYSLEKASFYKAYIKQDTLAGITFSLQTAQRCFEFQAPALTGTFNLYNLVAACAVAFENGVSDSDVMKALQTFDGVPGRLNKYSMPNGAAFFIDYAHNPASFTAVLSTLRYYTNRLIVVFGCGGDRDPIKRPIMGAIASQYADIVIVTADNPRSEQPQDIIKAILAGISTELQHKVVVELDREQAIKKAYEYSSVNTIIAVLGKGPDEYQLIQGVKYPFSERTIIKSLCSS